MDDSLMIPGHLVKRKLGYSMDVGGSLIKIVYTEEFGDGIKLNFKAYPIEQLNDAIAFLKVKTKGYPTDVTVAMSGISCLKYKDRLSRELNINIEILLEFDCFVDGFRLLTNAYSVSEITHRMSPYVHQYADKVASCMYSCQEAQAGQLGTRQKPWKQVSNKFSAMNTTQVKNGMTSMVEYPLLIASSGSAANLIKVEADGTYMCVDVNVTCGRYLMGVGSLLTGCKTYSELISLAQEGDAGAVDVQGRHLKLPDQGDVYAKYPDDNTVFGFGHAVGKKIGDFKKEDLAAGVVSSVVQSLAMGYHHWAMLLKVKQIFFCGGVTGGSQYIRDELGKYFECRCRGNALGIHTDYYFLKYGAYVGAIGGLLFNLERL